jgi:hypothetical protein
MFFIIELPLFGSFVLAFSFVIVLGFALSVAAIIAAAVLLEKRANKKAAI